MTLTSPAQGHAPVAVLVVTWNSAGVLSEFLASLPGGMAGTDWRLVVADNDSADDTVAVLRELAPDAVVVQTGRNAGYAAGINAALAATAGWAGGIRAALVCNPDVRMRQGLDAASELVHRLFDPLIEESSNLDQVSTGRRPSRN
jgi:N-acetylglucosaminyl-diphospho-decaprenol L-rhamnosyltransferase